MTRQLAMVSLLAVSLVMPQCLCAQSSFLVAGGINAPVGTLGDIADLGYNVAVGLAIGGPVVPVGVRLEGGYNGLGFKGGGGDVRILTGTANAIFNVGPASDAPYLIGGLGVYNRSFSTTLNSYGSSRTVLGINGGGGLRFPLSGLTTFFEARYHIMLGSSSETTNYQFIPITFGIVF